MIAVANLNQELLKLLPDESCEFGLHSVFGWIDTQSLRSRVQRRKNAGIKTDANAWICKGRIVQQKGETSIQSISGCEIKKENQQTWKVLTTLGEFLLMPAQNTHLAGALTTDPIVESKTFKKSLAFAFAALLMLALYLNLNRQTEEAAPAILEPVMVKIIPQTQKAVVVPSAVPLETVQNLKTVSKEDREVKRSIQQNLGFLGLLGSKTISKVLGGAPTVKDASAGAGEGNQGSGGEYLVGMGQGVKHATVGNTGVTGLGGVGTKGAGGGAGGYGNTMVGSGEGRGLSKVALAQDLVLEGGLDRAVIQATIAKYLSQVRACYEGGLQSNPGLQGQVNMNFIIAGDGSVSTAKVSKTTLGDAPVENCISSKMLNWKFPKPVGGVNVKVNYPFVLRPMGA